MLDTETVAAVRWEIEVTAMGLSLVSEGQLLQLEGAKDLNWLHPCHPLLHLLMARLRSNTAVRPDDRLVASRLVVQELSSSRICFDPVSARSVLRCYRLALWTTTNQRSVFSFDRLSVVWTSVVVVVVVVDSRNRDSRPLLPE